MLFFDEADAIASRRPSSLEHASSARPTPSSTCCCRSSSAFNGVVIFATNLAANFDPAFERRIRTHVLFEMPGGASREQIWRVQMHPRGRHSRATSTFARWRRRYEVSGGDIRNAVLKAAMAAAAEPGADLEKAIHQRHLDDGIRQVIAGKRVMRQSVLADAASEQALEAAFATAPVRVASVTVTVALVGSGAALLLSAAALIVALIK